MTTNKQKRMSMLDGLSTVKAPYPSDPTSAMSTNRALRSARDAVDAHHVWELDPAEIEDVRLADRLDPHDVEDLRTSIEANGQTVPILVRRHTNEPDRYLLVYGRRRLEAIRSSDKISKVRALVATLDDTSAVRAQVAENTGRRDLSFIERSLFAKQLMESGFGNQAQVAEVLNVTKSAISMALSVVDAVGTELAFAIGPAHGIGRPKWDALVRNLATTDLPKSELVKIAREARNGMQKQEVIDPEDAADRTDSSRLAFEAVARRINAASNTRALAKSLRKLAKTKTLIVGGKQAGTVQKSKHGVRVIIDTDDAAFAEWIEGEAQLILEDLHNRWKQRT